MPKRLRKWAIKINAKDIHNSIKQERKLNTNKNRNKCKDGKEHNEETHKLECN